MDKQILDENYLQAIPAIPILKRQTAYSERSSRPAKLGKPPIIITTISITTIEACLIKNLPTEPPLGDYFLRVLHLPYSYGYLYDSVFDESKLFLYSLMKLTGDFESLQFLVDVKAGKLKLKRNSGLDIVVWVTQAREKDFVFLKLYFQRRAGDLFEYMTVFNEIENLVNIVDDSGDI